MQSTNMLVISDPPHGDVKIEAAAVVLGLPAEHTRLKIGFAAPEILAVSDLDRANDVAGSLRSAGVSVQIRDGADLTRVPWPSLVSSFELGEGGLRADLGDGVVEIGYDDHVLAARCEPPTGFTAPPDAPKAAADAAVGPAASEAIEWIPHVDFYYAEGGSTRRISIAGEGVGSLVGACTQRFNNLVVDARLVGVRPRRRFLAGDQGFNPDQRKRYAFGTLLLRHVLESISPELRDITQYELGSRLAFVLRRGGPA